MISSAQWAAYNKAVESIVEGSRRALEAELTEWVGGHPGAGTAEIRREAERMMRGRVQEADKAAASLAAQWYDSQGKAAGMRLDRAVTSVAFDEATVDRVAHYQAQKLEDGDIPGFIEMCSELVGNDAVRSLNATIMRNAARDKRKGVKFARVTSGRNTCPWCLMLAGRGAVYHTRESAGAMGRFHRHCSCKIVPSFSGNKYEVLVEGHDPKKIENRLKDIERLTGTRRGTAEFDREVELRDPDWLFGDEATTDYSLCPKKSYGTLLKPGDYSLENIADPGNECRDLWAHHVLESCGYKVKTRPPEAKNALGKVMDGVTCPDIFIGDEIWEIKSPPPRKAPVKPGNELKFINQQMKSAAGNFDNPYDVELKAPMSSRPPKRVVLNVRYVGIDIDIESKPFVNKLTAEMKQFQISEVMAIDGEGRIVRYKRSA